MKRGKRLLAILLVLILSVSTAGCSKFAQQNQSSSETTSSKKMTLEDVKKRVINEASEYLKKNYPDDNFTFVSIGSTNWAYNYYRLSFKSEKYDNQQFMVYGSLNDESEVTPYTYSDDYYQYYMKDDAEEYFSLKLKKYLENEFVIKVRFKCGIGFTKAVNNNQTFIENIENDNFRCLVYIFSNQEFEQVDNEIKKFAKETADNNITIKIYYIYTKQLLTVSKYTTNDIFDKLKSYSLDGNITPKYSTYDGTVNKY
jgi:hypothetical protein